MPEFSGENEENHDKRWPRLGMSTSGIQVKKHYRYANPLDDSPVPRHTLLPLPLQYTHYTEKFFLTRYPCIMHFLSPHSSYMSSPSYPITFQYRNNCDLFQPLRSTLLTPWSRVFEKLAVARMVKEIP
jgi:hypothetical protein